MAWSDAFDELGVTVASSDQLLRAGASWRLLTSAVRGGHLLRIRRDHYAVPSAPRAIITAVRIGGRIAGLTALSHSGIFAINQTLTHVHLDRAASRLRHPKAPLALPNARGLVGIEMYWATLIDRHDGSEASVGIRDALAQVLMRQDYRHAIASLDNALFLGAIDQVGLQDVFSHVPRRLVPLMGRVNGRAEAGQETVLRLLIEDAGLHCEIQVTFAGIGRVDIVVEGLVVVEADSRLAHHGWELHVRDRNRDIDLARIGHPSLRPAYQRTMNTPHDVLDAVLGLLAAANHFRVHV